MPALHILVARDNGNSTLTPTMLKLLIALVVLIVSALLLVAVLFALRALKRSRHAKASQDEDAFGSEKMSPSAYRRLTIQTTNTKSSFVIQETRSLVESSHSPPPSPLPEIRITFPDEMDKKTGRPQSGRVVVVRMGENNAMGLEPLYDEGLPPYQRDGAEGFQSLDLDRIGGLKEKELEGKRYS
jgi:hypothetical protein